MLNDNKNSNRVILNAEVLNDKKFSKVLTLNDEMLNDLSLDLTLQSLKIGVIGLGLIGGSIARALTKKCKVMEVLAYDMNHESLINAYNDGSITYACKAIKEMDACDLIFLCVPYDSAPAILTELSLFYKGIITDVISTKEKISNYILANHPEMRYVGGHPMAGSEKVGYSASNENLFENAPYILCRNVDATLIEKESEGSNNANDNKKFSSEINPLFSTKNRFDIIKNHPRDFELVKSLVVKMSAIPIEMSPREHDKAVGLISHLPHVVAYSLVNIVNDANDESLKYIAAGGFRDITRIASSDPSLWAGILCDSKDTLVTLLDDYIENLKATKNALESSDKAVLVKLFSKAKEYRDNIPLSKNIENHKVQIWVEIDDKPGMIGKIAVLLGDNKINIKNMNIQDNRAYEGGSLRITLSSNEDADFAGELFQKENLVFRIVK